MLPVLRLASRSATTAGVSGGSGTSFASSRALLAALGDIRVGLEGFDAAFPGGRAINAGLNPFAIARVFFAAAFADNRVLIVDFGARPITRIAFHATFRVSRALIVLSCGRRAAQSTLSTQVENRNSSLAS